MDKINRAFTTWKDEDLFRAATQGISKNRNKKSILAFEALKYLCMGLISNMTEESRRKFLLRTKQYLEQIYG